MIATPWFDSGGSGFEPEVGRTAKVGPFTGQLGYGGGS